MENPYTDRENCPIFRFTVTKEEMMIYTLAKARWYGGNPSAIYAAPIDEVFKSFYFEVAARQYKSTQFEMNKANNK